MELYCKHFVPLKTTAVERLTVLREPVVERIHCICYGLGLGLHLTSAVTDSTTQMIQSFSAEIIIIKANFLVLTANIVN